MAGCFSLVSDKSIREAAKAQSLRNEYYHTLDKLKKVVDTELAVDENVSTTAVPATSSAQNVCLSDKTNDAHQQKSKRPHSAVNSRTAVARAIMDPMSCSLLENDAATTTKKKVPTMQRQGRRTKQTSTTHHHLPLLSSDDEELLIAEDPDVDDAFEREFDKYVKRAGNPWTRRAAELSGRATSATLYRPTMKQTSSSSSFVGPKGVKMINEDKKRTMDAPEDTEDTDTKMSTEVENEHENGNAMGMTSCDGQQLVVPEHLTRPQSDERCHHMHEEASMFVAMMKAGKHSAAPVGGAHASTLGNRSSLPSNAPPPQQKPRKERSHVERSKRPLSAVEKLKKRQDGIMKLLTAARPKSATIRSVTAPPTANGDSTNDTGDGSSGSPHRDPHASSSQHELLGTVDFAECIVPAPTVQHAAPTSSTLRRQTRRQADDMHRFGGINGVESAADIERYVNRLHSTTTPAPHEEITIEELASPVVANDGDTEPVDTLNTLPEGAAATQTRGRQPAKATRQRRPLYESTSSPEAKHKTFLKRGTSNTAASGKKKKDERHHQQQQQKQDAHHDATDGSPVPSPAELTAVASDGDADDLLDYIQRQQRGGMAGGGDGVTCSVGDFDPALLANAAGDDTASMSVGAGTSATKRKLEDSLALDSMIGRRGGPPGTTSFRTKKAAKAAAAAEKRDLENRKGPQVQQEKVGKYVWNPDNFLKKPIFKRPKFSEPYTSELLERYTERVPPKLNRQRLPTSRVAVVVGVSEHDDPAFPSMVQIEQDAHAVADALHLAGYAVERLIGRGDEEIELPLMPGEASTVKQTQPAQTTFGGAFSTSNTFNTSFANQRPQSSMSLQRSESFARSPPEATQLPPPHQPSSTSILSPLTEFEPSPKPPLARPIPAALVTKSPVGTPTAQGQHATAPFSTENMDGAELGTPVAVSSSNKTFGAAHEIDREPRSKSASPLQDETVHLPTALPVPSATAVTADLQSPNPLPLGGAEDITECSSIIADGQATTGAASPTSSEYLRSNSESGSVHFAGSVTLGSTGHHRRGAVNQPQSSTVTIRPTLSNVKDMVAKYTLRGHLHASVMFVFIGFGCVKESNMVSDAPIKLLCCADSKPNMYHTFFPMDITNVPPPELQSRMDAHAMGASSASFGSSSFGSGSFNAGSGGSGDEKQSRPRSNITTLCDCRAMGYQQYGFGSIQADSLGGHVSLQYPPLASNNDLISAHGGVLSSIFVRAFTGKAVRDMRVTPNSLNVFIANRLTYNKLKCFTTATPLQFGDCDMISGKRLNALRATLRSKRMSKSRDYTSVKVHCFVSEVGARDFSTVTSQFMRKIRTTSKYHMDREYLTISSSYLEGTFYVVFKTIDAYNMAVSELEGHCTRNIKLPTMFGDSSTPTFGSVATFGGFGATSPSGRSATYSPLQCTTVKEASQLRLKIEVPSEPPSIRQDAVAVVKQYLSQRSVAAKVYLTAELNIMTTARGRRKMEGLLRHQVFAPSLIFDSIVLDKEQMARIFCAITIQAYWRRYITQKRFLVGRQLLKEHKATWKNELIPEWERGFCDLVEELHHSMRTVQCDSEGIVRARIEEIEFLQRQDVLRTLNRNFTRIIANGNGPLRYLRPLTLQEKLIPKGRKEQWELTTYSMILSEDEEEVLLEVAPEKRDLIEGYVAPDMELETSDRSHLRLDYMLNWGKTNAQDGRNRALQRWGMLRNDEKQAQNTFNVFRHSLVPKEIPGSAKQLNSRRWRRASSIIGDISAAAAAEREEMVIVRSRNEIERDEERKRFLLEWRLATEVLCMSEVDAGRGTLFALSDTIVGEVKTRFAIEEEYHVAVLRMISELRQYLVLPSRIMPQPPINPFDCGGVSLGDRGDDVDSVLQGGSS